jgi:hypothetical protein
MTLIKKCDVANYFSSRRQNRLRLHRAASQPDATGFSGTQSGHTDSKASKMAEKAPNKPVPAELEAPPTNISL